MQMDFFKKLLNIFKNKRIFLSILLFFVLGGIMIPRSTRAILIPLIIWGIYKSGQLTIAGVYNAVIMSTAGIIMAITGVLTDVAANLLTAFMSLATDGISYTNSQIVQIGWPVTRDLANMFIVLGFVIVGIATTLRFNEYGAKKLLPKLIGVAILINFSLLFCGVIIDGSNIVTKYFLAGNQVGQWQTASSTMTKNLVDNMENNDPFNFMGKVAGVTFFNVMALIIFILYFFLFAFRIFALWILVILSPLAFVAWIFPRTKDFFTMWWKNFLQWCIIGAPAAFFLYLASRMQTDTTLITSRINVSTILKLDGDTAKSFTNILGFFVPGMLLVVGFLFSLKTSAMGAGAITSQAQKGFGKLKGYAGSFGKNIAGKAADVTGVSRGTKYMQNKAMELAERTGISKPGSAARFKAKQMEGYGADMEYLDEGKLAEFAKVKNPRGDEARRNKAKAIEILSRRKRLDVIGNEKEISEALNHTDQYYGGDKAKNIRREAQKVMPDLAENNIPQVDALLAKNNPTIPGINSKNATPAQLTAAKLAAKRDAFAKMDKTEIKGMHSDDLKTLAGQNTAQGAAALEEMMTRGDLRDVVDSSGTKLTEPQIIDRIDNAETFGSTARKTTEELYPTIAKNNAKLLGELATEGITAGNRPDFAVVDTIQKLSIPKLSKVHKKEITEHMLTANGNALKEAAKGMSSGQIAQLKKYAVIGSPEALRLEALCDQLEAEGREQEALNIMENILVIIPSL